MTLLEIKTNFNSGSGSFKMTFFEAINEFDEFLKEMDTKFIVEKFYDDEYYVCFETSRWDVKETGKDMIDTIVRVVKKVKMDDDDITMTEHEKAVFNNLAAVIEDNPFLHFSMLRKSSGEYEFCLTDYNIDYGKVISNVDNVNFENAINETICQARTNLALADERHSLSKIAEFIAYENSKHSDNDTEFIIRKEDNKYSVQVRVNRANANPAIEVGALSNDLGCAVKLALEKTNSIDKWTNEYALFKLWREYEYPFIEISYVLISPKYRHLAFRISENTDTGGANHGNCFKVEFVDTSSGKVFAESYTNNGNLRKAVFDVVKKIKSIS